MLGLFPLSRFRPLGRPTGDQREWMALLLASAGVDALQSPLLRWLGASGVRVSRQHFHDAAGGWFRATVGCYYLARCNTRFVTRGVMETLFVAGLGRRGRRELA